jgi:hypothetical protein
MLLFRIPFTFCTYEINGKLEMFKISIKSVNALEPRQRIDIDRARLPNSSKNWLKIANKTKTRLRLPLWQFTPPCHTNNRDLVRVLFILFRQSFEASKTCSVSYNYLLVFFILCSRCKMVMLFWIFPAFPPAIIRRYRPSQYNFS